MLRTAHPGKRLPLGAMGDVAELYSEEQNSQACFFKNPSSGCMWRRLRSQALQGRRGMVRNYAEITHVGDDGGPTYRSDRR